MGAVDGLIRLDKRQKIGKNKEVKLAAQWAQMAKFDGLLLVNYSRHKALLRLWLVCAVRWIGCAGWAGRGRQMGEKCPF